MKRLDKATHILKLELEIARLEGKALPLYLRYRSSMFVMIFSSKLSKLFQYLAIPFSIYMFITNYDHMASSILIYILSWSFVFLVMFKTSHTYYNLYRGNETLVKYKSLVTELHNVKRHC